MEVWVLIAIAASAFQTIRFMLQKKLNMGTLSTGGATFSRFFYSMPFILPLTILYAFMAGHGLPKLDTLFWPYALIGGASQILATWCVVALFQRRNFAIGITFKKTEVLLTALVGLVVLGDNISMAGFLAIALGLVGVLIISQKPGDIAGHWASRIINLGTGLGVLSGLFFAFSAVGYRGATLAVLSDDPLYRSSISLLLVTASQTVGMLIWLKFKEPGEITRVIAARHAAVWLGVTGMAGSLCWFTAFTLQNAAYVFAVGQIEIIFSLIVSALFFRETIIRRELIGIGIITASILYLIITS